MEPGMEFGTEKCVSWSWLVGKVGEGVVLPLYRDPVGALHQPTGQA